MKKHTNKEIYLQRRAQQLIQWERVIDKLKLRADKSEDKSKTDLNHHILKIQVKKARTEVQLRQLQKAENGNWDDLKTSLEQSWTDLRRAFIRASARPK